MKRILFFALAIVFTSNLFAQSCYWVFLTDKQGTTFDPYSYFDAKAIERYRLNNADLYDLSNYPLNSSYVSQIDAIAVEEVGQTRWFNAVAVMATPDQITAIEQLPFVKETKLIASQMQIAQYRAEATSDADVDAALTASLDAQGQPVLTDQLLRMQGQLFRDNGIDGKGIRIAIFDAGFPHVNTHAAFSHLRNNHQIVKTWNFPEKKENVYGWGTHGTMVLSCVTGILGERQLGLATGSEFLLARTEINTEPFKEEVWWMQAVEWADQNGANVINSSLGYGKERHYTYEMDGRSFVAKAANMAARKGMLVCNSAGNEGDDDSWKTIITPSDADSVLCVGGIEDNLNTYRHINFSSYGPSADGRLKPNVCNFGHVVAAKPGNDTASDMVSGTSFSSPLTAGFCACAWQTRPGMTAMQMKSEIEHSADLYPYFDYAFGYGVPQASYFVTKNKPAARPTFTFEDRNGYIAVVPTGVLNSKPYEKRKITVDTTTKEAPDPNTLKGSITIGMNMMLTHSNITSPQQTVFFKVEDTKGVVEQYTSLEFPKFDKAVALAFPKTGLYRKTLTVNFDGYTDTYKLSDLDNKQLLDNGGILDFEYQVIDTTEYYSEDYNETLSRTPEDNTVDDKPIQRDLSILYGNMIRTTSNETTINPYSPAVRVEFRCTKPISKWYGLGMGFGFGTDMYRFDKNQVNALDALLNTAQANNPTFKKKYFSHSELSVELFQRIRIVAGGLLGKGVNWDLGVYGSWGYSSYNVEYTYPENSLATAEVRNFKNPNFIDNYEWNYGVATRLTYDFVGLYARYRLTEIGSSQMIPAVALPTDFYLNLPRLEVGLQINF